MGSAAPRIKNMSLKLTEGEYQTIHRAAELERRKPSSLARHGALGYADGILKLALQSNTPEPKKQEGAASAPTPTPRGVEAEAGPENAQIP